MPKVDRLGNLGTPDRIPMDDMEILGKTLGFMTSDGVSKSTDFGKATI